MTNKIEINIIRNETQIKVNGEYIGTIKGIIKPDMPVLEHSSSDKSQRYGNEHGYVWISI